MPLPHLVDDTPGKTVADLTPEGRRRAAYLQRHSHNWSEQVRERVGPGTRAFEVLKRTLVGTYNEGFIHAGNLAYLSMLAIFPFFILGSAIFALIGEDGERASAVYAVLTALPPVVRKVIEPVALNVIEARSGWLLWAGALFGLWTVGSLIETIRDILRRAYGTHATVSFWRTRLYTSGIIIASVVLLIVSLLANVVIGAAQQFISAYLPQFDSILGDLSLTRLVPAFGLFGSIYMLFYTLTPARYRKRRYPKWPGALLVTAWWVGVTVLLPPLLRSVFTYDLTYGSLAGMMIALFFFWLVGLGMVLGAELNAALAETPEEGAANTPDEDGFGDGSGDEAGNDAGKDTGARAAG
jgi:membrane protein